MVSIINIVCRDEQAARWGDNPNRLHAGCAELQVNPVIRIERIDSLCFDAGKIGTIVSVEIGNGKGRPRPDGSNGRVLSISFRSRSRSKSDEAEPEQ